MPNPQEEAGPRRHETLAHDLEARLRRLGTLERGLLARVLEHKTVARDTSVAFDAQLTFGQRVADRVAAFGGSWTFIGLFGLVIVVWIAGNLLTPERFDPYPFILLNLVLSCLAAMQAPVIMMSQNRQAVRDRIEAHHDYEVNLKAEMEIAGLHVKLDDLRDREWQNLLVLQQRQLDLLETLVRRLEQAADPEAPPPAT